MQKMGVEVSIFNLNEFREGFLEKHPDINLPVLFGKSIDLPSLAGNFDAVIATANFSVKWLEGISPQTVKS